MTLAYDAEYTFGTWHVDSPLEWVLYPIVMVGPVLLLILCVGFLFAIAFTEGTDRELDFGVILKGAGIFAGCALISLLIAGAFSL